MGLFLGGVFCGVFLLAAVLFLIEAEKVAIARLEAANSYLEYEEKKFNEGIELEKIKRRQEWMKEEGVAFVCTVENAEREGY